jgi:hypothetical protein
MPISIAESQIERPTLRGGFLRALVATPQLLPWALIVSAPCAAAALMHERWTQGHELLELSSSIVQAMLLELAALALLPSAVAALRGERLSARVGALLCLRRSPVLLGALLAQWILIAIGLLALWLPGLLLTVSTFLVLPIVLLERRGIVEAFRRSDQRVVGSFFRVLSGVIFLYFWLPDPVVPIQRPYDLTALSPELFWLVWLFCGVSVWIWACFSASAYVRLPEPQPEPSTVATGNAAA